MDRERFDALKAKIQATKDDRDSYKSRLQDVAEKMKASSALLKLLPSEIKEKLGLD